MARPRHLAALAVVVIASTVASWAGAATSSTVVTMDVPSATQLTNGCTAQSATALGIVQPGGSALTATDAGRCTVSWASSNDSSMLRMAQRDGTGTAMAPSTAFSGTSDWAMFTAVDTVDGTNVIAAGNGGNFASSVDGGSSWTLTYGLGGNSGEFRDIDQVPGTPSEAWATGYNDRLHLITGAFTTPTTTDFLPAVEAAGWPTTAAPVSVLAVDADTAFVGGDSGWLAKTDDDGLSWTVYQLPSTGAIIELMLAPTGDVWLVSRNSIWQTTAATGTSAASWTQHTVAASSSLTSIAVSGASNGYAVGYGGDIYSWDGTSWTARTDPVVSEDLLTGVVSSASAPATATAVGNDGAIIRTTDGGLTWSRLNSPVGGHLLEVALGSGGLVAVGHARATVGSTDNGATWSYRSDVASARGKRGLAIDPIDGDIVLAVGSRGTIWRSTNGGAAWTTVTSGTTEALFGVAFATPQIAWAVGSGGTTLRSDDAGLTWSARSSGTTRRLMSVAAPHASTMIAVGDVGTVLRTTDGGSSFTSQTVAGGAQLHGVTAPTTRRAVLVGRHTMLRSTDNGASWTAPTTMPSPTHLRAVSMADENHGIAVQLWSAIWRTTDGGATWSYVSVGSLEGTAVHMATSKVAYMGGRDLRRTTDGGLTWELVSVGASWPSAVVASDLNHVVVGRPWGGGYSRHSSTTAGLAIPDYGASPNSWAASTEGMFGVCVQAIGAQTSVAAPWAVDGGTCTASDTDPWRAVPSAATTVATVPTPGNSGSVDLVFGMRIPASQPPGTYSAGVVFEALAPSA